MLSLSGIWWLRQPSWQIPRSVHQSPSLQGGFCKAIENQQPAKRWFDTAGL